MQTTIVNLTATRGDSLERVFLLAQGGTAMSAEDAATLQARFTQLHFQIRKSADDATALVDATGEEGAIEILTSPAAVALHIPASRMQALSAAGEYDLELTEPRPGHPLGDLVWTVASGKIRPRKDVTRSA